MISGGTFSEAVAETNCAVGFVPTLNEDGTYSVAKVETSLELNHNYIALEIGDVYALEATVKPNGGTNAVKWAVESNAGIISVDQNGLVTAHAVGTDYVLATIGNGTNNLVARCRVDVTVGELKIEEVQLSTKNLTAELFSTKYAQLDVILLLDQNDPEKIEKPTVANEMMMGVVANNAMNSLAGQNEENAEISIEKAVFANAAMNDLFKLEITDDRTLSVVPVKETAIDNPGSVKSSYTSAIILTIRGEEIETDEIKLTVKKTRPSVKASVAAFNSFYTEETREIAFTGATVKSVALNAEKTVPEWLTLNVDCTELSLTEGKAPVKSTSGKVYLEVETAEWAIPADVTLTVKNTYKARSLKLSSTSISISEDVENSTGVALTLKPGSSKQTLAELNVKGIEAPEGYSVAGFNAATGEFVLKTTKHFSSESIKLNVTFKDTDAKLPLTLKVEQVPVKLKLSDTSVTLNTQVEDAVIVELTATPADYMISDVKLTLTDRNGNPVAENFDGLFYDIDSENNIIVVGTTETTVANELYYLYVMAGSNRVRMTIKTTGKDPSMSLSAKGTIDLSFPETSAQIIATLKDCNMIVPDAISLVITDKSGNDVTESFVFDEYPNSYEIFAGDDVEIGTYTAEIKAVLNEGDEDEMELVKTKTFTVKRTSVKVKLSTSKVTLNKKLGDVASVGVTCTTKGYAFEEPALTYDDTKLDIQYVDGMLMIGLKEGAEFGKTYKVTVSAHEGAAATVTLSVAVLKESAVVKSTIKASGSVDVIRDNTKITIKPTYTNALNVNAAEQAELFIYSNENKDNYKTPIAEKDLPFDITVDENGIFTLTANDKLNSSVKYKAELVTTIGGETIKSSKISLSVKMGSAKLKLYAPAVKKLYTKDINSRVEFSIASTDATVNGIKEVELVESKLSKSYRGIFEVIDYGNGEYAIGFVDGANVKKVQGKTITLTLKTTVEGNVTTKTNGNLTIKITVAK